MPTYIAAVTPHAEGYQASFPDFPGLEAKAATLEAVRIEAQGLLEEHLATSFEQDALPEARAIETVAAQAPGATLLALFVHAPKSRAVRINITIPEDLLTAVDRSATAHGISRSRFLAKAVESVVTGKRHDGIQIPLKAEVLAAVDKAAEAHGLNRLPFLSGVIEVAVGLKKGHGKRHG